LGEQLGRGLPDASSRTRNESDFSVQPHKPLICQEIASSQK
jgi:hypothetical protein